MTRYPLLSLALGLALLAAACGAPVAQPAPSQPSSPPTASPAAPPASQPTAAPRPTSASAPTPAPSGPTGTTPAARTGTVDVRVTDAPPKDVTKILVTSSKIEAQVTGANGESGWRTILEKPPVFDLVAVTAIEASLGTNLLPEGTYQQVRLSVDKVVVTVAGVDKEAEVPSDKLRVVGGFEVAAGKTTVVTLDFDAEKSVVLAGPKVMVKPVVKLLVKQPADKPDPAKGPLTSAARVQLVLAQDKSEARFLARETIANVPVPRDAIGKTTKVTGALALNADGKVVKEQSRIVVDMQSLQTDNANRDRFIKANTLEIVKYPTAEFVVTEVKGLPLPLSTSGVLKFQLIGDMTLHGATKPVTWDVTAQANEGGMIGRASAAVNFADFGMTKPLTAVVLSIEDNVRLEVDFTATRG